MAISFRELLYFSLLYCLFGSVCKSCAGVIYCRKGIGGTKYGDAGTGGGVIAALRLAKRFIFFIIPSRRGRKTPDKKETV